MAAFENQRTALYNAVLLDWGLVNCESVYRKLFSEDLGGGKDSVVQCSPVGLGLGALRIGISEVIF